MKTDKHIYKIFAAHPQWLFELTGLKSPGECVMKAASLKEIEQNADGVVFPDDPSEMLTVVEAQFRNDPTIYVRTALEMALLQRENNLRPVQGIIFFRYPSLDPQTPPWNRIIHSFLLRDVLKQLEEQKPHHPLVAVFKPVLVTVDETLEKEAVNYYRDIKQAEIDESVKTALLEVFVSWVEQRLKTKGKKEIEKMLLGELPDLRETQSGKDLIAIGVEEGKKEGKKEGKIEGKKEMLIVLLEEKFGELPESRKQHIGDLSAEKLDQLLRQFVKVNSIGEMSW